MIHGKIELERYPRIFLEIRENSRAEKRKFLIDTGFDDEIALPYRDADFFEFELLDYVEVSYASGESAEELVATGHIMWFGERREVSIILSNDEEPAIGTKLLKNCVMTMNFAQNTLSIQQQS